MKLLNCLKTVGPLLDFWNSNKMDAITNIPGLWHISADIFNLLDKKSLVNCRLVNHSWREFLNKPKFWLKRLDEDEANYNKITPESESIFDNSGSESSSDDSESESSSSDDDTLPSLHSYSVQFRFSCFDILCWKRLAQVLDEYPHDMTEVFVVFLIKMHRNKSMQPLEVVKMLAENTSPNFWVCA